MSESIPSPKPAEFHAPTWDYEAQTPVVDGKYLDRATGELQTATGAEYSGPPAVDIVISSIAEPNLGCIWRCARRFPVQTILWEMMRVVHERRLEIDSLMATPYAIRLVLAHEMTEEEMKDVSIAMTDGWW